MNRWRVFLVPLLVGFMAACANGGSSSGGLPSATTTPVAASSPTPTPIVETTTTSPVAQPPGPSAIETKYLAAAREDAGEDATDAEVIAQGHSACEFYRGAEHPPHEDISSTGDETPPKAASDREVALFFLDASGYYDEPAVKYLCPKLLDELAWANAGFTEGDTEVGGKHGIKPGRYHADGPVSDCYWERVTGGGRTIANSFIKYAPKGVTVTVRSSDGGINTDGCGSWLPVKRP